MAICFRYAFCTASGEITENVFVSPNDAEMWATRLSEDNPGTLYIYDEDCWVPDMVFGLPDDDLSVVARGMAFVSAVNACPGVTHNYLREHAYNIWFTCIGPSREEVQATLDGITAQTGVPILNLPATRMFKIRVDFRMQD